MWKNGSPDQPLPGMLLETDKAGFILIGDCNEGLNFYSACDRTLVIVRWRWLVDLEEVRKNECSSRQS